MKLASGQLFGTRQINIISSYRIRVTKAGLWLIADKCLWAYNIEGPTNGCKNF